MLILENAASTGDAVLLWMGVSQASRTLVCKGDFDGATVTLESSLDGGVTWWPVEDLVFTSPERATINVPTVVLVRGHIADAGSDTSITIELE